MTRIKGFDPHTMVACDDRVRGHARQRSHAGAASSPLAAKRFGGIRAGASNGERGYQLTFAIAYIRDFLLDHWIIGESFETSVPWSAALASARSEAACASRSTQRAASPGRRSPRRVTQLYDTGVCIYFYFAFSIKGSRTRRGLRRDRAQQRATRSCARAARSRTTTASASCVNTSSTGSPPPRPWTP